jgi:hypothetical protein
VTRTFSISTGPATAGPFCDVLKGVDEA